MAESTEDDIHALIGAEHGVDTRSLEFRTTDDQLASLRHDLVRIQAYPLLPDDLAVGGGDLRRRHRQPASRYRSTPRRLSPAGGHGQSRRRVGA